MAIRYRTEASRASPLLEYALMHRLPVEFHDDYSAFLTMPGPISEADQRGQVAKRNSTRDQALSKNAE